MGGLQRHEGVNSDLDGMISIRCQATDLKRGRLSLLATGWLVPPQGPLLRRLLRVLEFAVAVEMRGNAQEGQESVRPTPLGRGCVCCTALHMPARLAHFVGQHWGHHAQ